MYMKVRIYTI